MGRSDKNGAIPDGWRIARLGDVATLRPSQQDSDTDNDLPYVGLKHIANGGTLISTDAAGDYISLKTRFEAGDTLFGKLRPNLRKVVRAPFNGMSSTEILAIVARSPADKNFLSYVLRSDPMHNHTMQGITGTKMPRTSWSHMKNYGFLLPPLREQRAIAAVLDSIDEAIERTETVIAATEQVRDSLLHELLTCGVPGWHMEWREVPGVGTIPADWKVVRLGEVLDAGPTNGIYKPESEYGSGTWLIRIDDFVSGALVTTSAFQRIQVTDEEVVRYAVRRGDILMNSLSHIGKSVLVPELDEPALFESNMMKLSVSSAVHAEFAANVLLSKGSKAYFISRAKKAVQQASINQQDVSQMPMPLPSLPEQRTIAALLGSVDRAIDRGQEKRDGLTSLKASAADALLTGLVRVGV